MKLTAPLVAIFLVTGVFAISAKSIFAWDFPIFNFSFALLTPSPMPTFAPNPYITPQPTTSPTIKPSIAPTSKPTTKPSPKPSTTPVPQSITNIQSFIMQKINDYRISQGLSTVKTDPYTCNFAKTRAQEISTSFSHDSFTQRINSKTLPYPTYSLVIENIAMTSNYQDAVNLWINSSGHAENMRQDTPYVCVEKSGNYYAYLGWKP